MTYELSGMGVNNSSYLSDLYYESYINEKIRCEEKLAFALKESRIITESSYNNLTVIYEAKMGDKIKATWKKFVVFIKRMIAKFMESMSNLIYKNKDYLEKYKTIILEKKPKDIDYSYTGNYPEGIKRITNTELPLFDYTNYKSALKSDSDKDLVMKIMSGKPFNYDDNEELAIQFKNYFLDYDDGTKDGKLSDGSINMTDVYNFCYNFEKMEKVVKADENRIETSTRSIENMINNIIKSSNNKESNNTTQNDNKESDNAQNDNKESNNTAQTTQPTQNNTAQDNKESNNAKSNNNNNNNNNDNKSKIQNASYRFAAESYVTEAEDDNKYGMKISTNFTDVAQTTKDRNADEEKDMVNKATSSIDGDSVDDITKAADKWIRVCNALVSGKLEACRQIAKDYMAIIRAHVRSYGGEDIKDKSTNKAKSQASTYQKEADKAEDEAKKAEEETKK